jgi:hypothetical protein
MNAPFKWISAPTPNDPDHIRILDGWDLVNITTFLCPDLGTLGTHVTMNHECKDDFLALMKAIKEENLMEHLGPWCGAYNSRYKRGVAHDQNPAHVSNHASGHAFDVDCTRLPLGVPVAQTDRIRDIVPIAKEHNFVWGGEFHRIDGMHFQSIHSPFP